MSDDYSPIYQGDTGVPFAPVFIHKDGSAVSLAGATINMIMTNETGAIKVCNGTWIIDDDINGKAHYNWQSGDVDTSGIWQLYIEIVNSLGPVHPDVKLLQILPEP